MLLYSVIRSGRVHTVQYNNSNPFINRKLQEVRDRLNQLRDLIGHYQVGKKLMVYSVNIHQAVFVKTAVHLKKKPLPLYFIGKLSF